MYGLNLNSWRKFNLSQEVAYWMKEHRKYALWDWGAQSIILAVTYDMWEAVDKRWNLDGLGYKPDISNKEIELAFILHWNGSDKP